ncbi:COG4775 Outer membrane protein/protective antigen OMA87 [Burkholderiales bacterium]
MSTLLLRSSLPLAIAALFSTPTAQAQVQLPAPSVVAPAAASSDGVTLKDVRVEGLSRIEPGTVFSYLPVKVGDRVSQDSIAAAVRALYATGFFKDVQVALEGQVLVVIVEERPAIGALEVSGAKEFDAETLKKALSDSGIAEARIFDRAVLERAEQEIKRQYLGRGKYDVQVQTTTTPLERNRVALSIVIDEGEDARIREIRIVGAKRFAQSELLKEFQLTPSNWLSWYTKSDQYSRQKLSADLEALRAFYLNRGYLEFNIDSSLVSLSPDRKEVTITLVVQEGDPYRLGEISLTGDMLGQDQAFKNMIKLKKGEIYVNEQMLELTKRMTDRLGDLGYAFANVSPVPQLNRETKTADFLLQVDPGRRVYVRRINISGNAKTRDEVIRREMRQMESSWYDGERLKNSRNRIDRLGYFKNVELDTEQVAGAGDQVDVNVKVEELPLGSFTFGAGFSSTEKLVFSGSFSQQNFLGSGTSLSLEVNTSRVSRVFSVSYGDPYYTDEGVSRSIDLYTRTFNADELTALADYKLQSTGFGVRFGVPYTEDDRVFFGAVAEHTKVEGQLSANWSSFIEAYGNEANTVSLTAGWSRDTRDSGLAPTRGHYQYANLELATPLGDLEYVKGSYGLQWFLPVTKTITYATNLETSFGFGLGGQNYPVIKNFYAGGIGSVRAFQSSGIGPRDELGSAVGGNRRFTLNNELLSPLPGMSNDKSIRVFAYLDVGSVWGEDDKASFDDLRASAGLGLTWRSPVGPLKLSFGAPLKKKPTDTIQRFQFQITNGF